MRILLHLLILNITCLQAQNYNFTVNDSLKLRAELEVALGKEMTVRDYTIGDITADGKPDIIAIGSQQDKEANRTIYLFVNEKGNIFNLAAINENIVECEICGGAGVGDPYLRTVIKKNFFSLETVYGACTKDQVTVTFKYDKKRKWWFLHKDVTESYNCQGNEKGNIEAEVVIHSKEQYGITRFEDY